MLCEEKFYEIYNRPAEGISFSPYRICPIGAHSDHNLGKVTGLAIDKGIHIAFHPKQNGVIEMVSLQFPKRAQWHIREIGDKTGDWADYLRGATWALPKEYPLAVGLCGVIEGSLPIGGLSSSATVILAFLDALCKVNRIKLPPQNLIDIAFDAEKNYVGVNVGTLDQSCEVLSQKDHLLYLDCQDNRFELIPTSPTMKPYKIAIFFSGLEHSLAGSKYNMRVDELRAGVYALQAFAGFEYGKFNQANARDVSFNIYQAYKDRLPAPVNVKHFFTRYGNQFLTRFGKQFFTSFGNEFLYKITIPRTLFRFNGLPGDVNRRKSGFFSSSCKSKLVKVFFNSSACCIREERCFFILFFSSRRCRSFFSLTAS